MVGEGVPPVILMIFFLFFVSRSPRSRDTGVFRRSEWKWLKEHQWMSSRNISTNAQISAQTRFVFWLCKKGPGGIFWPIFWQKLAPETPWKSEFFQERGQKRVKEWREVTFMKEWVKALDDMRSPITFFVSEIRPLENFLGSKSNFQCKIYGVSNWRFHRHILMQLNSSAREIGLCPPCTWCEAYVYGGWGAK